MLLGETFGHHLVRVTMGIAHHVAEPKSPFLKLANQDRCLLSGLPQEEPWYSFGVKYLSFIDIENVGDYADHFNKKGAMEVRVAGTNFKR